MRAATRVIGTAPPWTARPPRHAAVLVIGLALVLAGALAPAPALAQPPDAPIYWYKFDSKEIYAVLAAHGDVKADFDWTRATVGIPFDGLPADVHWTHTLTVHQLENGTGDDFVTIHGTIDHIDPPHGEGPNPSMFDYRWDINAGDYALGPPPSTISGYQWDREYRANLTHAMHADNFWAGDGVWVWSSPLDGGAHGLLAYLWLVIGEHTDGRTPAANMGGGPMFGLPDATGNVSIAGGNIGVIYNPYTGDGGIAIEVGGIERRNFVAAHIHYGPGGQGIFDLGPVSQWVDNGSSQGTLGKVPQLVFLGRVINGPLPPTMIQSLAAGQGYVDIHTIQRPAGEVRGNLVLPLLDRPVSRVAPVFALAPAHPNPSRGTQRIGFTLPADGHARLLVYDASGAEVRALRDGVLAAGPHEVVWDGGDERGRATSPGVYFVRLDALGRQATIKIMRLR